MSRPTASILWFAVFTTLILLSQDYWSWDEETILGLMNYPTWLFYFFALQLILAIVLIIFNLTYWGKSTTKRKTRGHE